MPARKWTEEQRRALSEARKGAGNPAWKGGRTREQRLAYQQAYYEANRDQFRAYKFKQKYGITMDEYERRVMEQEGRCAICRTEPGRRLLDVDHDHLTGEVRGLLCEACNKALGGFQDDPDLLRAAADYLEGG